MSTEATLAGMQPIVIACGDHAGIGPEVSLKAVAEEARADSEVPFVLVGDLGQLTALNRTLRLSLELAGAGERSARVLVLDPRSEPLPAWNAPRSEVTAQAGLEYLRHAAEGCLRGEYSGLVTAPVCKESILRTGVAFVGQTEFLANLAGTPEVTMMLVGADALGRWLRVALVTTHVPLRQVAPELTSAGVERAIRQSSRACQLLGLSRARIAVCGLNPHAGEGGMLGDEEARIIEPAISRACSARMDVRGPLSGDTVFRDALRGDFDAVVAMYHDQGLAPLKVVASDNGVNWTLGLPFPRTSPDHGTAFDIAGRGVANPSSMRAAIQWAIRLARRGALRVTDEAN